MIKKHKEHELILVQKALADKEKENAAAKIDAKYKLIKFYERRKITRKLAGLQRALANLFTKTAGDIMSAEEKGIRKEMQKWQNDADYIDVRNTAAETCACVGMRVLALLCGPSFATARSANLHACVVGCAGLCQYYPHGVKYVSLFRNPGDKKKRSDSDDEDEPEVSSSEDEAEETAGAAAAGDEGAAAASGPVSKKKAKPSVEEMRAAVEAQRAAIRKQVTRAKADKARLAREAAGPSAPKRKRDEVRVTDELFQQDDEDDAPAAAKAPAADVDAADKRPSKKQRNEARTAAKKQESKKAAAVEAEADQGDEEGLFQSDDD